MRPQHGPGASHPMTLLAPTPTDDTLRPTPAGLWPERRDHAGPWSRTYHSVREETERRAAALSAEDQCVQSMPDASPTKWHRAHTTWFFEQFVLTPHARDYRRSTSASPICSIPITRRSARGMPGRGAA